MKRIFLLAFAGCLATVLLAACANSNSASSSAPSQAASSSQASSAPASSASLPTSEATSTSTSAAPAPTEDVAAMQTAIAQAAALGDTIEVTQLDLKAGGVTVEGILGFAGAESSTSSENGGIVIVAQTAPGGAEALAAEFEKFRDSRLDDRYAEFATAMNNTREARIVASGDIVVYAVSASADWAALDAAIASALAA